MRMVEIAIEEAKAAATQDLRRRWESFSAECRKESDESPQGFAESFWDRMKEMDTVVQLLCIETQR